MPHHRLGLPFWEPGTRVRISHTLAGGLVVANTTAAMADTLSACGMVRVGPGRWRLPDSAHRPADLDTIERLDDQLRHRHRVAVSTRVGAATVAAA